MPIPSESARVFNDIIDERERQIVQEGWSREHDDEHIDGELADAAACYAAGNVGLMTPDPVEKYIDVWPWSRDWWKSGDRRRELVKSAALIVAEIERLDRLTEEA